MGKWSLKKKIMAGSVATLSVLMVAIGVAGVMLFTMIQKNLGETENQVQRRISDQLDLTSILYNDMVSMGLATLKATAKEKGSPRLGEQVQVGPFTTPNLYLGDHSVLGNYEVVDRVKSMAGGTATLFVRSGEKFVRISTNVQKGDGSRAVGTELTPGGKAITQIQKKESYYGVVDILGKQYYTAYEPMLDGNGEVVGIWYTGYRLDSMSKLKESIAQLRNLSNGFFSVIDDRGNVQFQSDNAPEAFFKNNPDIQAWALSGETPETSMQGWRLTKTRFEAWNYTILAATPKADLYQLAAGWAALLLGPMLVLTMVVLAFAYLGINGINRQLNRAIQGLAESSKGVDGAAQQLSSASNELAEGTSDQAASLEETSSTLEELTSMVSSNTETARKLDEKAQAVQDIARQGSSAMARMVKMIQEIKSASDDTAKIIKTIDEIAFQTNLLALNAAVEAARAGDAGKGFAVVAEEVRNLAQRSAEAAKDTNELIVASQEKSDQGVNASSSVDEALNQVTSRINEMVAMVRQVAHSSEEQSEGIDQINQTVSRLGQSTQSGAATAQETSSASGQLLGMVDSLNHIVHELMVIVDGEVKRKKGDSLRGNGSLPAPKGKGKKKDSMEEFLTYSEVGEDSEQEERIALS